MKRFFAITVFCAALVIIVVSIHFQKVGVATSFQTIGETMARTVDVQNAAIEEPSANQLNHLACIMDGNRRWAKLRGLVSWSGHREGVQAVKRAVQFCIERKIPYLSLYTFSIENFKRSPEEKEYLFNLIVQEVQKGLEEFKRHGIRIKFLGDRTLFPTHLISLLEYVERETAHLNVLTLVFLFCYGGQQEMYAAAKDIADKVASGQLSKDDITQEMFENSLWSKDLPPPDLIIRTGCHHRLSNFLLYKSAYSELYFLDCLWPDITVEHLQQAYESFIKSQRKFGV